MATNTSATSQNHNGTGSQANFAISFPFLLNSEIEVTVGGVLKTLGTHYNIVGSEVQFTSGNEPDSGVANVVFNRDTNISTKRVDFEDGSVLTEADLDNNVNQVLFAQQELSNDYVKRDGSQTITGNLVFEGSTDDNNETTLAITDPTADRTITIPDRSGTVVTTGDSGTVTSTMISDGTILNVDVNASAAIQGTKISPNFGSQNIVTTGTASVGHTGVTGTLGVTGATSLGGTLGVTGASTFTGSIDANGGASIDNVQIGVTGDNEIDTSSGNLTIDSAGGTTTIDDNLIVSGTTTLQGNLGVNAAIVGFGTLGITGTATIPDITGGAVVTSGTSTSDTKVYSAKRAGEIFYGKGTVEEIQSGETWSSADDKVATTAAIDARIIDLVDDVGGFVPIANETSFPSTNPDINTSNANKGGTIVSVKAASTNLTAQSGTTLTIANGRGTGNAVIITGVSATIPSGFGFLVETTATDHTYAFHRLVPKATEVTTVAANATQVQTVHNNITQVQTVHNNISNINAVAADASDIGAVAAKATEIGLLGNADVITDMGILGTADVVADLAILGTADVVADMNALAVADVISDMNTLAVTSVINNMDSVASNVTNVNNVGGSITNVNAVASNLSSVNSFAETYRIGASNPAANVSSEGDLFFNTTSDTLKVYTGSAWVDGVTQTGDFALKTGNTFTGDNIYNDNVKAKFGTGSDLELFYTGSAGILRNTGSGDLTITCDNRIILGKTAGEKAIEINLDGNVELYYDGSKKLETTSYGALLSGALAVTGNIDCSSDTAKIRVGGAQDLELYHTGTNNHIDSVNGALVIRSDVFQLSTLDGTHKYINIPTDEQGVELYYDNNKKFETKTDGVIVTGELAASSTSINGTAVVTGNLDMPDNAKVLLGTGDDLQIFHNGTDSKIENSTGDLVIKADSFKLRNAAESEKLLDATANGAVKLYYDNNEHFRTEAGGAAVVDSNDSTSLRLEGSGGTSGYITGIGSTVIGLVDNVGHFHIKGTKDGSTELYFDNSKKFDTTSYGAYITGALHVNTDQAEVSGIKHIVYGGASLYQNASTGTGANQGFYVGNGVSGTDVYIWNYENAELQFATNGQLKWKIDSSGHFRASTDSAFDIGTNSVRIRNIYADTLYGDGSNLTGISTDLVGDTSPQLGGDLDTNSHHILLDDSHEVRFGDGQDFKLQHNGTDSYIINSTGILYRRSANHYFMNQDGSEYMFIAQNNGAFKAYYDGANKFQSESSGLLVNAGGHLRIANGTWTGNEAGKIQHHDNYLWFQGGSNGFVFRSSGGTNFVVINSSGHFEPQANNTYDMGTSSNRWRNVFTNDLNLSNEGGANDVDGTWGSYTIQEGAEDLFLVNKRNGKKYKFNLTEVS